MSEADDRMTFMSVQATAAPVLPRSGPTWTVDDWWALNGAATGDRFELIYGGLLVTPPPAWDHQWAGDALCRALIKAAPRHFRVATAAGIKFADDSALIPDVVVARREPLSRGPVPVGLVSLAVEVVSPSSRAFDRLYKPDIYAAAGVPNYWRVELAPFREQGGDRLPVLLAYVLDGEEYRLDQRAGAGTTALFTSPFEVEFDPGDLLDD